MPTLVNLRSQIKEILHTSIFTDSEITARLNLGVNLIAAGLPSSFGEIKTPPLPDLFSIATVDTVLSTAYASMPATYQRSLQFVADSSGREIDVYNSMIEFAEDNPLMDRDGSVDGVIEQGGRLYYQGIPTSVETLTLHFFRLPVDMSSDSESPDGLPDHLAEPLLVNYVCKELFQLLRDKNSPDRVIWHTQLFNQYMRALEISIPADNRSLFLFGE